MRYIILIFFCAIYFNANVFAQKDSSYYERLIEKSYKYMGSNLDSAMVVITNAKQQFSKKTIWYVKALNIESYIFNLRSQLNQAVLKIDTAIEISKANKYDSELASSYNTQSINYMYMGNYAKSIEVQFLCLDVAKKINERMLCGAVLNNISMNYEYLKDWDNAIMFGKEGLAIKTEVKDSSGILSSYINLSNYFYDKKLPDSTVSYDIKAIALAKKLGNYDILTHAYSSIGTIFFDKKQYDSSLYYHLLSYKTMRSDFSEINKISVYIGLLNLYCETNNTNGFIEINNQTKTIISKIDDPETLYNYYHILYEYYKKQNNIVPAFEALEKSNRYKQVLDSSSNNIEFQKLAIKYELNKKVVADSLVMQQQVNIAKTKAVESENKLLIVSIVLLVVIGVTAVMYNRSKALKRKNIISEQEKQLAEQEIQTQQLKTLQAQMNPHFVFNCFSTIDSLIIQGKQMEASVLVQRFSKLSRRILEHTSQQYITLEEEAKTLETYLQIEQTRSSNKFDFKIEENPSLLQYQIPPMLLQPFVENAVVHGVRALQNKQGLITIKFKESADKVKIIIEDNGVGRTKAAEIKKENLSPHRSMSMQLTLERLKALHKNNTAEYLQVLDKTNEESGTIVSIIIPKIGINA